ncbi:esterase/lipase family protein [Amycolatopsis sp. cg13]|uniref:esterase/lipase family protein n=1 Tax=Amycolatopsis sp. cg13 TaxID=3238807 RepID=UPI0035236226
MTSMLAAVLVAVPAAPAIAEDGPPLTTPVAELRQAVWCDGSVTPSAGREAALLVHGTGGDPHGYWGWNYERALPKAGFGVCTVALPDRAIGDPVISAEYVVYAARFAYQQSGRKIAMIGHSQGGTLVAWAAKFWPDVAAHAEDLVSLAGDMNGIALGNAVCALSSCAIAAWRAAVGSHFMHALQNAPLPQTSPVTSIYTQTDEVVFPQPAASHLSGAANIPVQAICPGRLADHLSLVPDAVGYALVLDALTHPGAADPARIGGRFGLCTSLFMPDVDVLTAPSALASIVGLAEVFTVAPKVNAEPPLPAYAAPYGG